MKPANYNTKTHILNYWHDRYTKESLTCRTRYYAKFVILTAKMLKRVSQQLKINDKLIKL